MLSKTYQLEPGPPAWSWARYERWLLQEWTRVLIDSESETALHAFLARHPSLLPGGEGGTASIGGHHGAFPPAVVTEAPLPGIDTRLPDFLWMSKHSGALTPVLIELESATKKWLTQKTRRQSAHLTQAINQVAEWRTWFERENNRLAFYELYRVDDVVRRYLRFQPVYCLIYGRRREFESDEKSSQLRSAMLPEWLHWMSYDRLWPNAGASNVFTAQLMRPERRFRVLHVPPTFKLGPNIAEYLPLLDNLVDAIEANELLPVGRRRFLIERRSYWMAWALNGATGVRGLDDWE